MSVKQINDKILSFGVGLLARIKYAIVYRYSDYEFLKLRQQKRELLKTKIAHSIYKKKV